ncbi:MAG: hypothetical protein LBL07_16715 [Tannerella sp.]|jgi:hypothetical protein|nr:hypothetical protein [Tannerella sp.]
MKKNILWIALLAPCTGTAIAQDAEITRKHVISKSTVYQTSEAGWAWKEDTWWWNDSITDTTPPDYTVTEEVTESSTENGVTTEHCYRTTLKVSETRETTAPGWKWFAGKWHYYRKETDLQPPNYRSTRTEEKEVVNLDCDKE